MIKLLLSPFGTVAVSVLVYAGASVAFWKTPAIPIEALMMDPTAAAKASAHGPSWNFINPEADQLIAELQEEKKALAKREQELNDYQARLQAEQSELGMVTQSVRQLQTDFDANVVQIAADEIVNLKKLAKVYADMEPSSAAKVLAEMPDDSIIKIMVFMKDPETAAIFESMAKQSEEQARRAAMLSERLRLSTVHNNPSAK